MKSSLFLQRTRSDVLAVVHSFKTDQGDARVRALDGGCEIGSTCRHAQNSPARGEVDIIPPAGSGVKNLNTVNRAGPFQTSNLFSGFEGSRVPGGSDDHAGRGVGGPAKIALADPAADGSLERFHQVAFQTHQD